MANQYCDALKIEVPSLAAVKDHREANTYARMLVALLERGTPMTLREVAEAFEAAGVGPVEECLASLKRCRPARPPVYRDGDVYALDPHDDDLDLWAFRLGLRPPKVPRLAIVRPEPAPLPGADVALSQAELGEAFRDAWLSSWSAQRIALAILDAHGCAMAPSDVVAKASSLCEYHALREDAAEWWRARAIEVRADGTWATVAGHPALASARKAVRKRLESRRRWDRVGPDPTVARATRRFAEAKRAARAAELAALRRALVHTFPADGPQALVVVDVSARTMVTAIGDDVAALAAQLDDYDWIGAVDVRRVLRSIDVEPGTRRLAELGPPQKTIGLNKRGRSLKLTTEMLVRGSCRISLPFGDAAKLGAYLANHQTSRLRRRLEADAKSLHALYTYGRLHGAVRLTWGFLDEMLAVPWVQCDEPRLYSMMREAVETGRELELVVGGVPGWADPWARAERYSIVPYGPYNAGVIAVRADGYVADEREIQLARFAGDE